MEKKMKGSFLWVLGLVILVLSANRVHAITCPEAVTNLMPCQPFLVGYGPPTPNVPCCDGAKTVNEKATTTEARRTLCDCFIKAVTSFGIKTERAMTLPHLCGITTPVPIDPSIKCSSIS